MSALSQSSAGQRRRNEAGHARFRTFARERDAMPVRRRLWKVVLGVTPSLHDWELQLSRELARGLEEGAEHRNEYGLRLVTLPTSSLAMSAVFSCVVMAQGWTMFPSAEFVELLKSRAECLLDCTELWKKFRQALLQNYGYNPRYPDGTQGCKLKRSQKRQVFLCGEIVYVQKTVASDIISSIPPTTDDQSCRSRSQSLASCKLSMTTRTLPLHSLLFSVWF